MKKINLIEWLSRNSHEKQKPQRFARYAAMLIMLLTLGVGQMWGAAKQRYIYVGISDNCDSNKKSGWGFNFWGGTSGGVIDGATNSTYIANWSDEYRQYHVFRVQVYDDNNMTNWTGGDSWWVPSSGISVDLTKKNAIFYYDENGSQGAWAGTYQVTSTASLAASSTSVAIGTNVTLTPSLSSNATYNEIKSTSYSVTTNPNSGGSVTSAGVFSATKAGSYTVTATVTYNAKDFTGITKTVDVTKTITVYATVTFDREGGSGGTGSQNATYNSATSNISAPSKDYHDFAGYWTEDDGTGTMVINASGVWQKNISNFTDNSSTAKWIILTNQTLHAKWTPKNYDISYLDKGGSSYSGSNGASLPNSYTYGTGVALTDGVRSGYRFDGWFDNSACTGDPVTSVSASDNGDKTFYALWTENPGGTVTLTAGTGGQVSKDNSSWGISKSYTGIKTTDALNIYAQASAGYTFSSWSRTSGTGTIASTTSASTTYTPVANADAELTANFTENTVTLTPSVSYDHGSSNYTASASNSGTVGVATTTNLSCSAPNAAHYTFAGWTLTNLTVTSGNAATDRSITVKITTPGSPIAAVANYNEVLTSPWTLKGGTNLTGNNWATECNLEKKTGHSTESVAYYTFNITSTNSGVSGSADDWSFKLINNSTWYGLTASDSYWWKSNTSANQALSTSGANIQICANVAGPYEVKVDYSTPASPTVTVTFPTSYTLTYSIGSVAGTSGTISTSPSTASGSKVLSGSSITLTGPAAKTGYTWKGWYSNAAGTTGKIDDVSRAITVTMNSNKTLYACYTENNYTVTVNAGAGGSVASASVTGHKDTKVTLPTATPNSGYYFTGWTTTVGSLTYTNQSSATTAQVNGLTAAATVQANFAPIWRLVGSMNSWNDGTNPLLNYYTEGGKNYVYVEVSLNSNTQYSFKVKDVQNSNMYKPTSSNTEITYANKATAQGMNNTVDGDPNQTIMTAAAGTYRFTWNITDKSIKVTYPTSYKVTFGRGTGGASISASGSTTGAITSGKYVANGENVTFTQTASTGYTFAGWYTAASGGSAVPTMAVNDNVLNTIAADATVYSRYTENMTTVNLVASPSGKGTFTSGGGAVTSVSAGVATKPTVTAVPATGYHLAGTIWSESSDYISLSSTNTAATTITATGTTGNSANLTATFTPNTYRVHFHRNGGAGETVYQNFTYDVAQNLTANTYTRTGYTFAGWALTTDGAVTYANSVEVSNLTSENGVDYHLYAKWTPNPYAVTLSTTGETGYGSNAPANQTATYGAAMPTITPPVGAPGYKFQGYFTEANGLGIQYYNADGTSAHPWDIASATTLHAYFLEAEITSLEHESSVAKADVAELVVNPVLNRAPENYIAICWTLHYADNDNPVDAEHWSVAAYTEGGTKPKQVKYTFTNLANGNYYVKATLRKSASAFSNICSDGTRMMDIHGDFHVVGNNTVTVRYMTTDLSSDFVLKAPTEVEVEAMSTAEITAPEIPGYTFNRWSIGDGISTSDAVTANPITISATYDGVLTARYTKKQMIYFNNTLGWDTVYVYFYNNGNYWGNANQGTGSRTDAHDGAYTGKHGGMTKIAGTNIYYFDLAANSVSLSLTNVAFTEKEQIDELYFSANNVIGRGDYSAALSMYVPLAGVDPVTKNGTGEYQSFYYEKGYWMNYPESTGYELRFYNKRATDGSGAPYELIAKRHKFEFTGDKTLPMSVSLDLEAGHDYYFKIYRVDGTYYGNNQQMTNGHSGDEGQSAWEFKTGTENAWVTASGAGNYTFTLTYGIDLSSNYNYLVGVRYPESTGDFRVLYSDAVRVTNHGSEGASWLASYVIPKTTESDTVSFFVREASTPKIKAQKCTATYEEGVTTVTWTDENEGADLLPDTISADGVYNFIFTKEDGELVLSAVEPYKGNFYIRVDGAGTSNWDNFRASDHLMPYSDYSFQQDTDPYSHYFCHWYDCSSGNKNIKFVVANDYSACVSDTIIRDGIADYYVDENGWLSGRNANIRFMYNYKTNEASRRYIDGAQESGSEFLVLIPEDDDMIYDAETGGSAYSQVTYSDKGNWLYEANVWVVPGTTYKLKSKFGIAPNLVEQYFKGAESGAGEYETLIGGSGSSRLQIRLLYDFKTNRLVSAYIPSSTISGNLAINADVMFIREGQGEMQQLTFENDAKLTDIKSVYSVLRFNKWTLNNRYSTGGHGLLPSPKSIYERSLYFVSFPFDVKLSDVFGFGTYWDEWYIEYYDGAARAKNGFWIDSESYWKYVTPAMKDTFTLKAGQGYIFGLDLDYLECHGEDEGEQANIWKNIQTADFIFPGNISTISNSSVTYTLPAHTCTINRGTASGNRTIADSHWNVLGVPTYLNTSSVTFEETTGDWMTDGKPKYIYSWNPQDNSLSATSAAGFTYHSMNAYVVQYYGNVTFSTSVSPIAAPRRNPEYRGEYEFRLEIQQNEQAIDHTFIRLTDDEEATVNFEFGLDLTKSINANKANIYTIVEGYLQAAGNCLPLTDQTTVVPVGVIAKTTGDYTFSIPEGTEGVGVTLIDNETGIRTSLSALDYNINLSAGTYDNRFVLEISPIQQTPTNVEVLNGGNGENGVRKVLIDGLLYIVKDGKVFDARGNRVK